MAGEGEVQARPVGVGVRLMGRRHHGPVDALERVDRLAVDGRQRRPTSRHFDRVDGEAEPHGRLEGRGVAALLHPLIDELGFETPSGGGFLSTTCMVEAMMWASPSSATSRTHPSDRPKLRLDSAAS